MMMVNSIDRDSPVRDTVFTTEGEDGEGEEEEEEDDTTSEEPITSLMLKPRTSAAPSSRGSSRLAISPAADLEPPTKSPSVGPMGKDTTVSIVEPEKVTCSSLSGTKLILCMVSVPVFLLTFGVVAIFTVLAKSKGNLHCHSSASALEECQRVSAEITARANFNADSCDDFYEYACGGWLANTKMPEGYQVWTRFSEQEHDNNLILKRILETKEPGLDGSSSEKKVFSFYETCLHYNESSSKPGKRLVELLRRDTSDGGLGGWPILDAKSEDSQDSNENGWVPMTHEAFQEKLEALHFRFHTPALFRSRLRSQKGVVYLEESGLSLANRDFYELADYESLVKKLKDLIFEVVKYLLQDAGELDVKAEIAMDEGHLQEIRNQVNDIIWFEERLAKLMTPKAHEVRHGRKYKSATVTSMQMNIPNGTLDLIKYISHFLPYTNTNSPLFNGSTLQIYYQSSNDYFDGLLKLLNQVLQSTRNKALENYLGWQLVKTLIPTLPLKYRLLSRDIDLALYESTVPPTRWSLCLKATTFSLAFPLSALFLREAFTQEMKEATKELAEEIISAGFNTKWYNYEKYAPSRAKRSDDQDNRFKRINPEFLKWLIKMNLTEAIPKYNASDPRTALVIDRKKATGFLKKHVNMGTLRATFKEKLENIPIIVGYPDFVFDQDFLDERYDSLEVIRVAEDSDGDGHFLNMLKALRFLRVDNFAQINFPEDRNEDAWPSKYPPHVVNAFFSQRGIGLLSGLLVQGLFKPMLPRVVNYPWIGSTIGHEVGHGIETSMSFFTKDIISKQCLVEQYSQYRVMEHHYIDGNFTYGENIADYIGTKLAFNAYDSWKKNVKKSAENRHQDWEEHKLPGLKHISGEKLFFILYAQNWCRKITPQAEQILLKLGPHPPGNVRVNGVLSNMKEFSQAFNCTKYQNMNRGSQCFPWEKKREEVEAAKGAGFGDTYSEWSSWIPAGLKTLIGSSL